MGVGTMHIVWSLGWVFSSKDPTWGLGAPLETWPVQVGARVLSAHVSEPSAGESFVLRGSPQAQEPGELARK